MVPHWVPFLVFGKITVKVVNYEKIQEVIQDKYINLSQFLDHLTKVLLFISI